jgi:hypothetical protein
MRIHFVTAEVDLQRSPQKMCQAVEMELQKQGEPLRWAVTDVNINTQKVLVEAVVTVTEGNE